MCNVLLKAARVQNGWGVTFGGSGRKESCDREPEAKTGGGRRGGE